jgi:hypothetical protein
MKKENKTKFLRVSENIDMAFRPALLSANHSTNDTDQYPDCEY